MRRRCQSLAVRWDRLFDDLGAQFEAAADEDFAAEIADRTRRERALIGLAERFTTARGTAIDVTAAGAGPISGVLRRSGPGWLLLDLGAGREALVATTAVSTVRRLPTSAAITAATTLVAARLDLGHLLRAIARDRSPVSVTMRDAAILTGTIDRVGADYLDLAEHPPDVPRRPAEVTGVRTVALTALAIVSRGTDPV
jgi:hypothetical protein